jgi:hypothetical protein
MKRQEQQGMFKKVRSARPQALPAFVAKGYFSGVALTRGAHSLREHDKGSTCLREAATAKAGNAADFIFQHPLERSN